MRELAPLRDSPDEAPIFRITSGIGVEALHLKSWSRDPQIGRKPIVVAGLVLPPQVGTSDASQVQALCIGPAEWLIVSQEREATRVRADIEPELAHYGIVLADLSDGLAVLQVRGCAVRDVLSKGCGIDLHPQVFAVGRCARTRLAQIPVVLACMDELTRFELYVPRSYSHYLRRWLADAAIEFETS